MREGQKSIAYLSFCLSLQKITFSYHFNIGPGKSSEMDHFLDPVYLEPSRSLNPVCPCYWLIWLCNRDDITDELMIIPSSQEVMGLLTAQSCWCNKHRLPSA